MRYDFPERSLEPPEDNRKMVYRCRICDGGIYAGDDYYEIPDLGPCCESCIDESKRYEAEPDWPEPDREG